MPTLIERLKDVFNSERRQRDANEKAALESWAIAQQRLSLDHTAKAMLPATAETQRDRAYLEVYNATPAEIRNLPSVEQAMERKANAETSNMVYGLYAEDTGEKFAVSSASELRAAFGSDQKLMGKIGCLAEGTSFVYALNGGDHEHPEAVIKAFREGEAVPESISTESTERFRAAREEVAIDADADVIQEVQWILQDEQIPHRIDESTTRLYVPGAYAEETEKLVHEWTAHMEQAANAPIEVEEVREGASEEAEYLEQWNADMREDQAYQRASSARMEAMKAEAIRDIGGSKDTQDVKRDSAETISPRETVNRAEERREYGVAILTTTDGSRAASVRDALEAGGIESVTRKNDMGIYTTYVAAEDLAAAKHWINLGQDHTVRTGYSSAEEEFAVPVYATTDSGKSITAEARLEAAGIESYTRVDANGVATTYVHKDDVADARSSLSAANNANKVMAQTYEKPAEMTASYSAGM